MLPLLIFVLFCTVSVAIICGITLVGVTPDFAATPVGQKIAVIIVSGSILFLLGSLFLRGVDLSMKSDEEEEGWFRKR